MKLQDYKNKVKFPKIGMRSIKTVIATTIAITLSNILGLESPFYPTMITFLCIQSTITESSEVALNKLAGTLIGGILALIYLVFIPDIVYVIPIGILAIIYLGNMLNKRDLISMSSVIFLTISFRVISGGDTDTVTFVIHRILETFLGVVIAILVNTYIKPPNPFEKLKSLDGEMALFVNNVISENEHFNKPDRLEEYSIKMDELRTLIEFYHKEANKKKSGIDIKYYMKHLTLFRSAYSYIYILDATINRMDEDIRQYHISNLLDIRKELNKK